MKSFALPSDLPFEEKYLLDFKRVKPAVGTLLEISLGNVSFDQAVKLSTMGFDLAQSLEKRLSYYDPQSELHCLNQCETDRPFKLSPALGEILIQGAELENFSNGAFRLMPECQHFAGPCYKIDRRSKKQAAAVTRNSNCRFDLGGIAKGYIVDQIFELIRTADESVFILVNAGGDLRTSHPQTIIIRVPSVDRTDRNYPVLLTTGALATSSRIGDHLEAGTQSAKYFDSPAQKADFASASAFAPLCLYADAFTKIALRQLQFHPEDSAEDSRFGVQILRFNEKGVCL